MKLYAKGEDLVPNLLRRTVDHMVFEAIAIEDAQDLDEKDQD